MPTEFKFHTPLQCRLVIQEPQHPAKVSLIVLALHGYGQNAATMLRLTDLLFHGRVAIAALQAPNQHYGSLGSPDSPIVYNWGTRENWAESVRMHHDMVLQSLRHLQEHYQIGAAQILLLGFSQPVGLNYRFAGTHPNTVGGILGICGGVPKDWESDLYHDFPTPILHLARDADEYFPVSVVEAFPARLRHHAADVEFHLLPGAHRFPSKAAPVVNPWLERVFGYR
jgi:predicted esterase